MSGFTSGEGCFSVAVYKTPNKVEAVRLTFIVTQHTRDEALLESFVTYFGCGQCYTDKNKDIISYKCSKFVDIYDKIIPFFVKHRVEGVKFLDYTD